MFGGHDASAVDGRGERKRARQRMRSWVMRSSAMGRESVCT